MKPPRFQYFAAASVAEAIAILHHHDGDARPLAGGQSLVPMLNFRLAAPGALVDLARIPALAYVREEDGRICIGGMARQRTVENDALVLRHVPLLREALGWVGHLPTRSRGTVCGSLAHADPSSEQPLALLTLDGSVLAQGPQGVREIGADQLFVSLFTTSLAPDEILVEARFPKAVPGTGHAMEEFSRRKGDFAIVAIAVCLRREGERCTHARIAAAGVDVRPIRLRQAEAALLQGGLHEGAVAEAAACARREVDPSSDLNASADYRRQLVAVLTARAIRRAAAMAWTFPDQIDKG